MEQIESYHLIEHIPHPQVPAMLRGDWHRILIPGGTVVLECPDLDKAVQEYIGGTATGCTASMAVSDFQETRTILATISNG